MKITFAKNTIMETTTLQRSHMPRGAKPSPRHKLAGAEPYRMVGPTPPNYLYNPNTLSFWGNNQYGDCVTAEEAFAKACNNPEILIPDTVVINWAQRNNFLNGAYLYEVLDKMLTNGFQINGSTYDIGQYTAVDWTNTAVLQNAISVGPVKIGIAADQLDNAYTAGNGQNGWIATGFNADNNEDHCVSLCGFGTLSWLATQFNTPLPAGINGEAPGYALFTWDSIGIIDQPSLLAITHEAWIRNPTTVVNHS
jgi:hypothetical protein